MFQFFKTSKLWVCIAVFVATALAADRLFAGYSFGGDGMQQIISGTVANGAINVQSNTTYISTTPTKPYTINTSYSSTACDSIVDSRLLLTLWGGTFNYTGTLTAKVNNTNVVTDLAIGGKSNTGVEFGTGVNVYGSGGGVWLVSIPVSSALLHTDGTTNNNVEWTINTTDTFDGRAVQASLWSVYQDDSLKNQFQYSIAEGSGDIYKSTSTLFSDVTYPTEMSRNVSLGSVNTEGVTSAKLLTMYTYGDSKEDRLYFNSIQLGGNNVATNKNGTTNPTYVPDLMSFDVMDSLSSSNNNVKFTLNSADGVTNPESSLRPQLAILAVTSIPEPGAIMLLATGALSALLFLAKRRRWTNV